MNELIKRTKKIPLKYLHIALIILGTVFLSLSVFHTNLWFDESYSVGIANHSFKDIWIIGGNDVHPVLYYCILHILNLIFGNNILIYRLFSTLCMAILGVIGFTHIRKDFGEKTGFTFSFLAFLFPVNLVYAGEIRMYSLAMLLVTLTSIYAYRIYKNKDFNLKNWIIFAICSLAGAYTHYYALMASGLINLLLMIMFITQLIKSKKLNKNIIAFIISGIIQVILYIPWLISLLTQIGNVSNGFWISINFPDTLIELFTFSFTGNLTGSEYINTTMAIIWSLAITVYMIYLYFKDIRKSKEEKAKLKKEMQPATLALKLFLGIALAACLVSLIIWRPIIYARYMLCVMGLFIFFLAYSMEKKGIKYLNMLLCIVSVAISLYININFIDTNYAYTNSEPIDYVKEDIQENDIILFGNDGSGFGSGFIISVNFPENISYFCDRQNWNCEEAYKAFSNEFVTVYDLDFLQDYTGRIWIINTIDYTIFDEVQEKYDITVIKQSMFSTEYKDYQYSITLVEK